jgi:deoxyribodipyrimidine photo-lyase
VETLRQTGWRVDLVLARIRATSRAMTSTTSEISPAPGIVWFRDDLRIADNPALSAAISRGAPVLCLYIHDEESEGLRPLGGASKWWLGRSLASLSAGLEARGANLHVFYGAAEPLIARIARETGAGAVFWNRRYGAAEQGIDACVKAALKSRDVEARSFNSHLLREPWEVTTQAGGPMKVFTPFWRAARALGEPALPLAGARKIVGVELPPVLKPLTI